MGSTSGLLMCSSDSGVYVWVDRCQCVFSHTYVHVSVCVCACVWVFSCGAVIWGSISHLGFT